MFNKINNPVIRNYNFAYVRWNIERELNVVNFILHSLVIFPANLTLLLIYGTDLPPERKILQFYNILPDLLLIGQPNLQFVTTGKCRQK